jgi:DNA-binding transcriptional LysR family regulator
LEERLGVRLLNRSSRRFSVTEIGREFYDRCLAMLVEAEAAEQVIAQVRSEPRGVVRMSCPIALLNFQFGALIAKFMVVNPAVDVQLESTNRRVDVIAEGFDVAIRVRFPPLEPTDLVMRRLDESIQCLVASPALIRTPLSSPSDLSGLPSLDPGPMHRDHQWQLHHKDGQTALIPHRPRLITDDIAVLREATLAGVGVVQLPTVMTVKTSAPGVLSMSCRNGSPAAASSMRCSRRGGACSRPSALCSTFSLGSAPSGASWLAAQHHDPCTDASPLSDCKFGSPHRTDRCGALFV